MISNAGPWLRLIFAALILAATTFAAAFPLRAASTASAEPAADAAVAAPPLAVVGLHLQPVSADGALYRLHARIRNDGARPASALRFQVSVAGRMLPVYERQDFMLPLTPQEVSTVPLFNFRAPESSSAAEPVTVEVSLVAARWLEIEEDEGGEIHRLAEVVPGLPVRGSAKLPSPSRP